MAPAATSCSQLEFGPAARRSPAWPDVPLTCDAVSSVLPGVARRLRVLVPTLALTWGLRVSGSSPPRYGCPVLPLA